MIYQQQQQQNGRRPVFLQRTSFLKKTSKTTGPNSLGDPLQQYKGGNWKQQQQQQIGQLPVLLKIISMKQLGHIQWKLQEASLHEPLPKYNKASRLTNNNKMVNFLLWNYQAKFNVTSVEASLHDPLNHFTTESFPTYIRKKTRLIQNEVFLLTKIKYDINIAFCKVIKTASYLYLMSC